MLTVIDSTLETHPNNDTVDVNSKDGFLGWLYIGVEKDDDKLEYEKDNGWEYSENNGLRFDVDDDDVKHAWLAPVYSVLSTSGM